MGSDPQGGNSEKNTQKKLPEALARNKWKPGQSGNLSGRPKKKPITEMYEQILNNPEHMQMVEQAIIKSLSRGQMAMVLQLREMAERVEGKVVQPIEADVSISTLAERMQKARERAAR